MLRCILLTWLMIQVTFKTGAVTWCQKPTLVYTLNPELIRRSIATYVQICQSHN